MFTGFFTGEQPSLRQKLLLFLFIFLSLFLLALVGNSQMAIALFFSGMFSLGVLGFWLFDRLTTTV